MALSTRSIAATAAALITPTIDEFEQANFYSSGQQLHQEKCRDATQQQQQQQHTLSGLESIIDASLPSFSFYSPENDVPLTDYDDCFLRTAAIISPRVLVDEACDVVTEGQSPCANNVTDVMQAADILCQFKNDDTLECSTEETAQLVGMAVEILAEDDDDAAALIDIDDAESFCCHDNQYDAVVAESLVHPNRLAIDEDAEEVNKLHQYVRKELLEIFVIPQQTSSESEDDDEEDNMDYDDIDDEDRDDEIDLKDTSKQLSIDTRTTRQLVTRCRSIEVCTSPPSSAAQRYYPGRVGLRCAYCANLRRKSTSKANFYPLRLKNIYREVCAWQRIHFKKCPHVPEGVRERYDHYKRIDTSRGKVRYWESSARKIGLENNPHRYVVRQLL